jgi:chromosome segregation protein
MLRPLAQLGRLQVERAVLDTEREQRREQAASARERSQAAQLELRDTLVLLESRRAGRASMAARCSACSSSARGSPRSTLPWRQRSPKAMRPSPRPSLRLQDQLSRRVQVERELADARRALEDNEGELQALEQRRLSALQSVAAAREAMEQARLAAQASSVRREALLEQFAATRCELSAVLSNLDADAQAQAWEQRLEQLRLDIEQARSGQSDRDR